MGRMLDRLALHSVFILAVLVLALSLRASPTPRAEPFPPARFASLYIERYDKSISTSVRLDGDALIYKVTAGKIIVDQAVIHPSADDWFQFIKGLNDAKVYQWAPKYYYPGQGETWIIDLAMDDRKFLSSGTNEFPLAGNEAQPQANPASGPSVPFQLYWQAVLKLVGKTPPPVPAK